MLVGQKVMRETLSGNAGWFLYPSADESYGSSLYHVSNVVVLDRNMLGLVMKYVILCQSNPTHVVAIYHFNP